MNVIKLEFYNSGVFVLSKSYDELSGRITVIIAIWKRYKEYRLTINMMTQNQNFLDFLKEEVISLSFAQSMALYLKTKQPGKMSEGIPFVRFFELACSFDNVYRVLSCLCPQYASYESIFHTVHQSLGAMTPLF